jgi:hypothetical protein
LCDFGRYWYRSREKEGLRHSESSRYSTVSVAKACDMWLPSRVTTCSRDRRRATTAGAQFCNGRASQTGLEVAITAARKRGLGARIFPPSREVEPDGDPKDGGPGSAAVSSYSAARTEQLCPHRSLAKVAKMSRYEAVTVTVPGMHGARVWTGRRINSFPHRGNCGQRASRDKHGAAVARTGAKFARPGSLYTQPPPCSASSASS